MGSDTGENGARDAVWIVYAESDMTEGRGPMRPLHDLGYFDTEQDAWDAINERPGVMGRRVGVNCYPIDHHAQHGNRTWQDYKRTMGSAGDYDVRPLRHSGGNGNGPDQG